MSRRVFAGDRQSLGEPGMIIIRSTPATVQRTCRCLEPRASW